MFKAPSYVCATSLSNDTPFKISVSEIKLCSSIALVPVSSFARQKVLETFAITVNDPCPNTKLLVVSDIRCGVGY